MGRVKAEPAPEHTVQDYVRTIEMLADDPDREATPYEHRVLRAYAMQGAWIGMHNNYPLAISVDADFLRGIKG